jgi:hypothetical protein
MPEKLALPEFATGTSDEPRALDPHAAAALVDFCLALFNASEAVYLD